MRKTARASLRSFLLITLSLFAINANASIAFNVPLGTADAFAVLAGSAVTNTGPSTLNGNLAATSITGFPPGTVVGTIHSGDAEATAALSDLTTAYGAATAQACGTNLSGQDLGGLTLLPGVYCFSSSAQLTGALKLDALGDPNSIFLFQITSTLTTATNSEVSFINGGQGGGLFWQVGSSATLGTGTAFTGNLLALTSITLNAGANIQCGRALAQNGSVTMDTNDISVNTAGCETTNGSTVPEPGTSAQLGVGLLLSAIAYGSRKFRRG